MSTQSLRYEKAGINYRVPNLSVQVRKQKQPKAFEEPIPKDKISS